MSESDADLGRDLDASRNLGASRFRFDLDWSVVEPVKGALNWAPIDRMVNAATSHGLAPLAVLAYTPPWARVPGVNDSHGAPANPADFAAFAGEAAKRYSKSISDWEIWNEPNQSSFWAPAADPVAYTVVLKAAAAAIRAVQPGANVIAGALAPGADGVAGQFDPLTFAQAMYAAGARDAFTAMSIHPYSYPAMPTDPATASWNTFQKISRLHDLMVGSGDAGKPIWITEFGAPTGTAANAVTDAFQSDYLTTGINAARALGYVPTILIYAIRDSGTDQADPEQNFGLLRHDFSTKPSYAVVGGLAKPRGC